MKKETKQLIDFKITKNQQVKKHLIKRKSITSWEAIELYKATRLSAIIFDLRNKNNWKIETKSMSSKDINGNTTNFAKYVLIEKP